MEPDQTTYLERHIDVASSRVEKLEYMKQLVDRIFLTDPQKNIRIAGEGQTLAQALKDKESTAYFLWRQGISRAALSHFDAAESDLKKASRLFKGLGDREYQHKTMISLANLYNAKYAYRDALSVSLPALAYYRDNNIRSIDYARLTNAIGVAYSKTGEFARSLEYYYECLEILETEDQGRGTEGAVYLNIGQVHYFMDNPEKALTYFQRALEVFKRAENPDGAAKAYSYLANVYMYGPRKKYKEALQYLFKTLEYVTKVGLRMEAVKTLLDIGSVYTFLQEYDRSLSYLDQAHDMMQTMVDEHHYLFPFLYVRKAEAFMHVGNARASLNCLKKASTIVEQGDHPLLAVTIHHHFSEYYEKRKNYGKALYHYKEMQRIEQRHMGSDQQRAVFAIETRAANDRLAREQADLRIKLQRLEQEKAHKDKEAELQNLHLLQKNELLGKIQTYVESSHRGAKGASKDIVAEIRGYLRDSAEADAQRSQLEQSLGRLQLDFMDRLAIKVPELTTVELKVCALLKMRLSTADIANILFISPQTVYTHRKRIRRKLELPEGEKLQAYLDGVQPEPS